MTSRDARLPDSGKDGKKRRGACMYVWWYMPVPRCVRASEKPCLVLLDFDDAVFLFPFFLLFLGQADGQHTVVHRGTDLFLLHVFG